MSYSFDFNEIDDILKGAQEQVAKRKNCKGEDRFQKIEKYVDDTKEDNNGAQAAEEHSISKFVSNGNEKGNLTTFFERRITKLEKALDELADMKERMRRRSEKEEHFQDKVSVYSTSTEVNRLVNIPLPEIDSSTSSVPSVPTQVTGFTKCGPSTGANNPFFKSAPSPSQEWKDCTNRVPDPVHPICCGPSKVKPIFDSKIETLENQIVKHCLEIKDTNILLAQCCRSKEVLECQKHALHNVLLKLCGKIKELEKKLQTIKMAICCPNMPAICTSSFDCREEVKNMRRIEEKIETCYNGLKHKECLLNICKKTVEVLKQDKDQWDKDMQEMDKIKTELQKQIGDMRQKVCKKSDNKQSSLHVSHRLSRERCSQHDRTSSQLKRVQKQSSGEDISEEHRKHKRGHRLAGS